jgi:hypothetical protein
VQIEGAKNKRITKGELKEYRYSVALSVKIRTRKMQRKTVRLIRARGLHRKIILAVQEVD